MPRPNLKIDPQLEFICLDCPMRSCDVRALYCLYRWRTGDLNANQKRKVEHDKKREAKRATETRRTRYWRERARRLREQGLI